MIDKRINGFKVKYSIRGCYPVLQDDDSISMMTLFRNYQCTYDANQNTNLVLRKTSFI